jgi:3-phenylpropionate/trans-cinnamate dioxygenase ferredoxin subunit
MGFERVAGLEEIGEGEVLAVAAGGKPVCLARVEGIVYAFADNCSHRDFPLSQGELDTDDYSITCDWHGARFDIRSGEVLALPATRPIRVYPCRIEADAVYVDVD